MACATMHTLNPIRERGSVTSTVKRNGVYRKRRTRALRQVAGFTTKPKATIKSDGIRRARMIDALTGAETRVRVDQFFKSYETVYIP